MIRSPQSSAVSGLYRAARFAPVLAALVLAGPLLAQPPALLGVYEGLRLGIETESVESVVAQFAPLMRLEASATGGWLTDLSTMFAQRDNLAAEMRFDTVEVVGEKAFVLVTWAFTGKSAETGEAWSETVQRADLLVQQGGAWRMLGSDKVDQEALKTKITDGQFSEPKNGLEVTAPPKWRLLPLAGMKTSVTTLAPDLTATITWLAVDVPGTFAVEQLARGQEEAIQKLAPTLGLAVRDASAAPDTLAGRPAYRARRTVATTDGFEVYTDVTYCLVGSTMYICARSAFPPAAYAAHEAAIDRSVELTKIVEAQAGELPPEAGRVEDRKYINDVYGCEITAPEGWDVRVGQSQFKLQVTICEPGGASTLTLGMVMLPSSAVTAQAVIRGEDDVTSKAFEGFSLIKQGETKVGDLPAYESLSTFNFGGQKRQRQRVYLVDNDRLFFMFADAAPADQWARLAPLFNQTFQSFRLIEARPPQ